MKAKKKPTKAGERTQYIIQGHGGYVADYNEDEGSCEWVGNYKNAHRFSGLVAATKAAARLDLNEPEFVATALPKQPSTKALTDLFRM